MKKHAIELFHTLRFNIRPLLYFEFLYRLLGLFIVFPFFTFLFYLSLSLAGYDYVTDREILDYLFQPTTILILIVVLIVLGIYVVVEMCFLNVLFHFSLIKKKVTLRDLLGIGTRTVLSLAKRYHAMAIVPAIIFFVTVELAHVSQLATFLNIPDYASDYIESVAWFPYLLALFIPVLIALFSESVYVNHIMIFDRMSLFDLMKDQRRMLKGSRFKLITEFFVLNIILNVIFFLFYGVSILLVAGFIALTRGQTIVLAYLLTALHSIYVIVGFLSTMLLFPINFALISVWFHEKRIRDFRKVFDFPHALSRIRLRPGVIRRTAILLAAILVFMNAVSVYAWINEARAPVQILNYPRIIAHRGSSSSAPENTLAAIELGLDEGADAIEFDVRQTRDGVPVLMHDRTLLRTTDATEMVYVEDVSYLELAERDAGSWHSEEYIGERVPTLEEALLLIEGRAKAYIELKTESNVLESEVIRLIEEYDMVDEVNILSFTSDQLERIAARNDEIETTLLMSAFLGDVDVLIGYEHVDHFAFDVRFALDEQAIIRRLQDENRTVYVYTANTIAYIERATELGVDG
ncbi:MAG: glycerophosphodiester phosphodiesterase family protein, partial [Acholeplasmataceae bacterium]